MKKNIRHIITAVAIIAVAVLVMINRQLSLRQEEAADKMQLNFTINGENTVYYYNDNDENYTTFDTQMKRKNGDIFDKNYSGIFMAAIIEDMGVEITDEISVSVVCADNYEIQLTGGELMAEGNIYLITKENGEKLAETDGPFMLVINNDEFSTRWAKNVVRVKVNEK